MKKTLTVEDFRRIFKEISKIMDENKDYLCKLDGALGDGDIGLTMSKGFKAINESLTDIAEANVGTLMMRSAAAMGENAPSTMGTLMASAFIRAAKASQGKQEITTDDLVTMTQAMVQGITDRGKAKVGDKTILDSMTPALEAMEVARNEGKSLQEVLLAAHEAAEQGAQKTIDMQSRLGRAGRYLERSIGHQDPGATVGALFFEGFTKYIQSIN
jgi:dihydroxyacetone kinase-like protein